MLPDWAFLEEFGEFGVVGHCLLDGLEVSGSTASGSKAASAALGVWCGVGLCGFECLIGRFVLGCGGCWGWLGGFSG